MKYLLFIILISTSLKAQSIELNNIIGSNKAGQYPRGTTQVTVDDSIRYLLKYDSIGWADIKNKPTSNGGMDSLFNGVRQVARTPTAGVNMNATTFREWMNWWYVGNYTQPTLSMNQPTTPVEVGTSNNYTFTGSTTNPCGYTLASGQLLAPISYSFGSATSYSRAYTHAPTTTGNTAFTAQQGWTMTTTACQSGTPTTGTASISRTVSNVFPVLWGMSSTSYTSGAVPYNIWNKRVALEGNQASLTMNGTNMYMYILIPKSWSDWTVLSIIDHNNFDVTSSFTGYDVTVTSTGLVNNWTTNYRLYKLNNLTTATNYNYVYNR